MNHPDAEASPVNRFLQLRTRKHRLFFVTGFCLFATAALFRYEKSQCLDANGAVLWESSGIYWSGQDSEPVITPAGGTNIKSIRINFIPPLIFRNDRPVSVLAAPSTTAPTSR